MVALARERAGDVQLSLFTAKCSEATATAATAAACSSVSSSMLQCFSQRKEEKNQFDVQTNTSDFFTAKSIHHVTPCTPARLHPHHPTQALTFEEDKVTLARGWCHRPFPQLMMARCTRSFEKFSENALEQKLRSIRRRTAYWECCCALLLYFGLCGPQYAPRVYAYWRCGSRENIKMTENELNLNSFLPHLIFLRAKTHDLFPRF